VKRDGTTLIELIIIFAVIILFTILVFSLFGNQDCDGPQFLQTKTYRNLSGSATKLTCLDGHEYYLINSMEKIALAPKFDADGLPAKCKMEAQ